MCIWMLSWCISVLGNFSFTCLLPRPVQKVGVPKRAPSAFFLFVNVNRPYFKERYPGEDDDLKWTMLLPHVNDLDCLTTSYMFPRHAKCDDGQGMLRYVERGESPSLPIFLFPSIVYNFTYSLVYNRAHNISFPNPKRADI